MKIQSIRIKNFRTLKDVTIPFDSVTTFIGPNGNAYGFAVEAMQGLMSLKESSFSQSVFDIQDFFSNDLGSQFFGGGSFKQNQPLGPQLTPFFENRLTTRNWVSSQNDVFNSGSAAGGFLLYPNKSNTNQMQSVYAK